MSISPKNTFCRGIKYWYVCPAKPVNPVVILALKIFYFFAPPDLLAEVELDLAAEVVLVELEAVVGLEQVVAVFWLEQVVLEPEQGVVDLLD